MDAFAAIEGFYQVRYLRTSFTAKNATTSSKILPSFRNADLYLISKCTDLQGSLLSEQDPCSTLQRTTDGCNGRQVEPVSPSVRPFKLSRRISLFPEEIGRRIFVPSSRVVQLLKPFDLGNNPLSSRAHFSRILTRFVKPLDASDLLQHSKTLDLLLTRSRSAPGFFPYSKDISD